MKYFLILGLFLTASAFAQDNSVQGRWTPEDIKKECLIKSTAPGGGGAVQFTRCMNLSGYKIGRQKTPYEIQRMQQAEDYFNPSGTAAAPARPPQPPSPKLF